jgi:hypothetical protein
MATEYDNRQLLFPTIILGACLLIGLITGGYFIGKGVTRFKSDARIVTVKGLVEKEVKADQAIWSLNLKYASNDLKDAHTKISADREATLAFLKKKGFKEEEIDRQPTRTIDKVAREYGQSQSADRFRYVVTNSLVVKTNKVDWVRTALGETEELLKSGVVLDGERESGAANPRCRLAPMTAASCAPSATIPSITGCRRQVARSRSIRTPSPASVTTIARPTRPGCRRPRRRMHATR